MEITVNSLAHLCLFRFTENSCVMFLLLHLDVHNTYVALASG